MKQHWDDPDIPIVLWQIGISLPSVGYEGDVIFKEPYRILHVAAGISQDCEIACAPPSLATTATGQTVNGMHQAGTEDAEEEEAFLESVTGQRSSRDMTAEHAPLMRVRRVGSDAWDASCVLQPGSSMLEGDRVSSNLYYRNWPYLMTARLFSLHSNW